ncbi:caspase family protein [Jeotgalibaca caeni]|uniref:caspase family protein n=1 Tax=Jeotgalibaca caeni TaxID=3028623 RepID=UPI00237E4ED9|nr:caspase family protein [Jeotgalibaca caeni]MDE1550024.1 caspase family protein [Jeotgalibaca caeni]
MRAALIVGIDYYEEISPLFGCVNDAYAVNAVLERHDGGSLNFDCNLMTGTGKQNLIEKSELKDSIEELFKKEIDVALFYFAGHGYIESAGGYILAGNSRRGDEGVSLSDILYYANNSPAKNKIIILDSCHSGIAGNLPGEQTATLSEGVTVLTASAEDQYASEQDGSGVFTTLLVDALNGSAANLTGDVTPGSIYAHIDQSLGAWEQRPIFKTNVRQFVSLRKVTPPISTNILRRITEFFPDPGFEYQLDPTYEPEEKGRDKGMPNPIKEHTEIFSILQQYNRLNLLFPVDADHMWNAAMESKSCKLTALGEHYRRLAAKKRI